MSSITSRAIKRAILDRARDGIIRMDEMFIRVGEPPNELEVDYRSIDDHSFFVKVREQGTWRYFKVSISEPI